MPWLAVAKVAEALPHWDTSRRARWLAGSQMTWPLTVRSPCTAALVTTPVQNCGLCTWHVPSYADGMPTSRFQVDHAIAGGGVFRPFEEGNESSAELVLRTSQAIMDIAHQHHGSTVVLVGHSETVESSFHALAAQPLYRAFDVKVAPASVTEWVTDDIPPVGRRLAGPFAASTMPAVVDTRFVPKIFIKRQSKRPLLPPRVRGRQCDPPSHISPACKPTLIRSRPASQQSSSAASRALSWGLSRERCFGVFG
jgi:hypothetical protein